MRLLRPSATRGMPRSLRARGATLVELLVGVALALFILSGLLVVFVGGSKALAACCWRPGCGRTCVRRWS